MHQKIVKGKMSNKSSLIKLNEASFMSFSYMRVTRYHKMMTVA